MVLVLVLGIGAVHQRSTITAYAPGLIPVYDRLGMAVRPQIDKLQIIDLMPIMPAIHFGFVAGW